MKPQYPRSQSVSSAGSAVAGHAVQVDVGGHDRPRARPQRHLERRQQHVGQLPRADGDRGHVAPAARGGVAGEVLQRGHHPGRLQPAHVAAADQADQVRVLADRLLHPAPAQVADHVKDRGQALVHAVPAHRRPDLRGHPLDELRVERRAPAQRGRVHGGLPGQHPGQALLVHHGRDAEAAGRDDLVLEHGHGTGAVGRGHRGGAEHPGELADPGIEQGVPVRHGRGVVLVRHDLAARGVHADPDAVELGDLFPQGHAGEQVAHPLGRRGCRVAPGLGVNAALDRHVAAVLTGKGAARPGLTAGSPGWSRA